jgi:hypothetical protein
MNDLDGSAAVVDTTVCFTDADTIDAASPVWGYDGSTAKQVTSSLEHMYNQQDGSTAPIIASAAAQGSAGMLFADGIAIGSPRADAGAGTFAAASLRMLPPHPEPLIASVVPAPISPSAAEKLTDGIITADFGSVDLSVAMSQGIGLAFVGGAEAVLLTDGSLGVGLRVNEATTQRLHEGLLGRGNDKGGISSYDAQVTPGARSPTVISEFLPSNQFIPVREVAADQPFGDASSQDLLWRLADAGPSSGFWTNLLAQGGSPGDIAIDVTDSSEVTVHLTSIAARTYLPNASAGWP